MLLLCFSNSDISRLWRDTDFFLLSWARYASLWKGCLTLYTGRGGELHKIGE